MFIFLTMRSVLEAVNSAVPVEAPRHAILSCTRCAVRSTTLRWHPTEDVVPNVSQRSSMSAVMHMRSLDITGFPPLGEIERCILARSPAVSFESLILGRCACPSQHAPYSRSDRYSPRRMAYFRTAPGDDQ